MIEIGRRLFWTTAASPVLSADDTRRLLDSIAIEKTD